MSLGAIGGEIWSLLEIEGVLGRSRVKYRVCGRNSESGGDRG